MLVVNDNSLSPFLSAIVIISSELSQIWFHTVVMNPPVEIDNFRSVFVYQLTTAAQPVIQEFFGRCRCGERIIMLFLFHGRPIEISSFQWLFDIRIEVLAMSHKEPVLYSVAGCTFYQSLFVKCSVQFTQYISLWSHIGSIPF